MNSRQRRLLQKFLGSFKIVYEHGFKFSRFQFDFIVLSF